jgi:hypothetical protein
LEDAVDEESSLDELKDKCLLVDHIRTKIFSSVSNGSNQVDVLQSHFVIFMITKTKTEIGEEVLEHLE